MSDVIEIRLPGVGIGRVWETSPNRFSWAHPDGSEGEEKSFDEAVKALEEISNE